MSPAGSSRSVFRALNGVFPILKPAGNTSAQTLNHLKAKLRDELALKLPWEDTNFKLGHGGTLDSSAYGVLGVGIGEGTQQLSCLLHGGKTYQVIGCLGVATTTYNQKGKITMEMPFGHVTETLLQEKLQHFHGSISQTPPAYSALKRKGRRYSDLIQAGIEFSMEPRVVRCYKVELRAFRSPHFTLVVSCGPGFYIRSLINDLGMAVGSCAHVCELLRIKHGPFHLADCLPEEQWTCAAIINSIKKHRRPVYELYKSYKKKKNCDW